MLSCNRFMMGSKTENEKFLESKAAEVVIDLDNGQPDEANVDLTMIKDLVLYDETGQRHSMESIWSDFKTILVFVRSFLCFTCRDYVEDLAKVPREVLKEKQIRLVVIGCADWKHIKEFRRATKYPYLIFCDVDYDIYNKLNFLKVNDLGQASQSQHVKSGNIRGVINSAVNAVMTSPAFDFQGSLNQQGGQLIVGPGPEVHYLHRDKNARDHTPINVLLDKVGIPPVDFTPVAPGAVDTV